MSPKGERDVVKKTVEKVRSRTGARELSASENDLYAQEFQRLVECRKQYFVNVDQPLVLISQVQRSGGTLLSQLFDAHPQVHAHPYELYIGYPEKEIWPVLDLNAGPETWFETLFEKIAVKLFFKGYEKRSKASGEEYETFSFMMPPSLQRALFEHCMSRVPVRQARQIFDGYMTAYFNSWLDNQNLYSGPKRAITAFVPRMNFDPVNLENFFKVYPDGTFITMIRDPRSWFVSAKRHNPLLYGDRDGALSIWRTSLESSLTIKERFPDRTVVLFFEDLVRSTGPVMRALASVVGIDFTEDLMRPTFNGMPIKADSSFKVERYGVIQEPLSSFEHHLTPSDKAFIEETALPLYEQARRGPGVLRVG